jgi:hypothetical protein
MVNSFSSNYIRENINKMKLKTLKDLPRVFNGISEGALKQEAIKWVKEIDCEYCLDDVSYCCLLCWSKGLDECEGKKKHDKYTINNLDRPTLLTFLKFFFNITEEDLK